MLPNAVSSLMCRLLLMSVDNQTISMAHLLHGKVEGSPPPRRSTLSYKCSYVASATSFGFDTEFPVKVPSKKQCGDPISVR